MGNVPEEPDIPLVGTDDALEFEVGKGADVGLEDGAPDSGPVEVVPTMKEEEPVGPLDRVVLDIGNGADEAEIDVGTGTPELKLVEPVTRGSEEEAPVGALETVELDIEGNTLSVGLPVREDVWLVSDGGVVPLGPDVGRPDGEVVGTGCSVLPVVGPVCRPEPVGPLREVEFDNGNGAVVEIALVDVVGSAVNVEVVLPESASVAEAEKPLEVEF